MNKFVYTKVHLYIQIDIKTVIFGHFWAICIYKFVFVYTKIQNVLCGKMSKFVYTKVRLYIQIGKKWAFLGIFGHFLSKKLGFVYTKSYFFFKMSYFFNFQKFLYFSFYIKGFYMPFLGHFEFVYTKFLKT